MKVIHLHGFGSSGTSDKARMLISAFSSFHVFSPDLPIDPSAVIELVDEYVKDYGEEGIMFVGTSLGGFYSHYFAQKYKVPCVIVNPCTKPSLALGGAVGKQQINHATGEEFMVLEQHIEKFKSMEMELDGYDHALVSMFVAQDDEVLKPRHMKADIPNRAFFIETKTGGHRYTDNWGLVISRASHVAKTPMRAKQST